jgi:hypothetical protein
MTDMHFLSNVLKKEINYNFFNNEHQCPTTHTMLQHNSKKLTIRFENFEPRCKLIQLRKIQGENN